MEDVDVGFAETTQIFRIGAASCAVPGAPAGPRGRPPRLRHAALAGAARAGDRARARRRRADAAAGAPARGPRPDPPPHARRAAPSSARRGGGSSPASGSSCPTSRTRSSCSREHGVARDLRRRASRARSRPTSASAAARSRCATWRTTASSGGGPVRASFRGHEFVSNPPPSSGGVLIGYGLALLDRLGPGGPAGKRRGDRAAGRGDARAEPRPRARASARDLHRGGLDAPAVTTTRAARRTRSSAVGGGRRTSRSSTPTATPPRCTASTGSGSGVVVPGTGIHLNNMLGEFDLAASAGPRRPGRADDEHDGAVDRAARTAIRGWSSAARARCGCAARSCRSSSTSPSTACRVERGDRRPARPPAGRGRPLRGRGRPGASSTGSRRSATTSSAGAGATSTSAARPPSRSVRTAALAAAGDPRRGGAGVVVE